jgi:hypothetical protein
VPDPRPFESWASLLRRSEPRWSPALTGRPRRHGPKMKCNDPSTWPEPSTQYTCEDTGYGAVRVRAWANLHPKVRAHEVRGSRGLLPIVVGSRFHRPSWT